MTRPGTAPVPLVPQRRFSGVRFGAHRSPRRGEGDEVAGMRPYRRGDRTSWIDWKASARLSAARGTDEFVTREFFAEQAPRVVVVCDRRPGMRLYDAPLPWLDKAAAAEEVLRLLAASAIAERGDLAYVDHATERGTWLPPSRSAHGRLLTARLASTPWEGPEDGLARSLELLARRRTLLPVGTFVFVVSDFLAPPPARAWAPFRALLLDVTPVIVQDPTWEQRFPHVRSTVLEVVDPDTGRRRRLDRARRAQVAGERGAAAHDRRGVRSPRLRSRRGRFQCAAGRQCGLYPMGRPTAEGSAGGGVIRVVAVLCGLWLLLPAAALGAPSIRAEVSSPRTSVGRPFDYVVRATLDSEDDAREARILAPIGAFQAVGPSSVERDGREVRFTQRLACLGPGCVPGRENRVVPLPAARVVADGRTTAAPTVSIAVVPRVPAAVVAARDPVYRRQTEIPPAGFSPRPTVLAALAAGGAALLVLVAVVLVATGLRGRARAAAPRRTSTSAPFGSCGSRRAGRARTAGGRRGSSGG